MTDNQPSKKIDLSYYTALYEIKLFGCVKYIEHHLTHSDLIDEDGYPTDEALEIIEKWPWHMGIRRLFGLIESLWNFKDFGWHQEESDEKTTYNISTGGWSGNESLIYAFQKAPMIWSVVWVQSRRGGHYIFELNKGELNW